MRFGHIKRQKSSYVGFYQLLTKLTDHFNKIKGRFTESSTVRWRFLWCLNRPYQFGFVTDQINSVTESWQALVGDKLPIVSIFCTEKYKFL